VKKILLLLAIIVVGGWGVISSGILGDTHVDAEVGGPFTLTDQNGKTVNDHDFRGKVMLVFFGFTSCPDLCPTTLLLMSQTVEQLKADAAKVAPIFVTVDPEHDTPAQMKTFLANFNPAIIGLTGTQKQIDDLKAGYKVYAEKVEAPKGEDKNAPSGQTFDHSGYMYLMDKHGKFVTAFGPDTTPQTIAEKIRENLE